jgi:hypothetical protein
MKAFDRGATKPRPDGEAAGEAGGDSRMRAVMQRRWSQRRAGGQSVDAQVARKVESATGADLSDVRVHTGADAADDARSLRARAFTVGQDVSFAAGQYQPGTQEGERLLTHELVHTVQQRGGAPSLQNKLEVSAPGDAAEREADDAASRITGGGRAQIGEHAPAIHRTPDGESAQSAPQQQGSAPQQQGPVGPGGAQGDPAPKEGGDQPVAKLDLCADTESADRTKLTFQELQEARVGHAWLKLSYLDPSRVPDQMGAPTHDLLKGGGTAFGFWPLVFRPAFFDPELAAQGGPRAQARQQRTEQRLEAGETPGAGASNNPADRGFKTNPFNSYVPGRVEEPDDEHEAKGQLSYTLTQKQVDALMGYVDSKRGAQYSLYFYNCTTFAVEAARAAGQPAPSGGLFAGICLPNALYSDILAEQLGGNPNATTTELEEGETQSPPKKKL